VKLISLNVSRALSHLHGMPKKVIHRDVKVKTLSSLTLRD
jgi:hypothetical protein